jgi:broad specificity phosphatase PhoE
VIGYYLTHPQVEIDPSVPVPDWSLSAEGRRRLEAVRPRSWLGTVRRIVSSTERKAVETAELLARGSSLVVETRPDMGENDRSSTGFLAPDRFEAAADAFFAAPDCSWNGWERAVDAQGRILRAVDAALRDQAPDAPILFVGHGAVGTLLKCALAGRAIARSEDQAAGGGNVFAFRLKDRTPLCDWIAIERFEGVHDDA